MKLRKKFEKIRKLSKIFKGRNINYLKIKKLQIMIKMNVKKIGILALLIVAVIIAVALIGGRTGIETKISPGGIALPSGFTEQTVPFLGFFPDMKGVGASIYIGSGTAENALNVFELAAIEAGWTRIEGEAEIPANGIPGFGIADAIITGAIFEKGSEELIIHIMEAQDQVTVTVIVGPKKAPQVPVEEIIPEVTGPPTSDVKGEDISDLPRYPGSIRVNYWRMSFGDGGEKLTVIYVTSASIDEVLSFYQKELPVNGWVDITEGQVEDTFMLMGHKEGANVKISIYLGDIDYPGHTLIALIVDRI